MNPETSRCTPQHDVLPTPAELRARFPLSERARLRIAEHRREVADILTGRDPRLLVVIGPCSIHDPEAALDYAGQLQALSRRHRERLLLCLRVYLEKPRTTVGWKGLLHDPQLDGSCDLAEGLRISRRLLVELSELGLPLASELLEPLAAPYLCETLSFGAIGARTTESQVHRQLASSLPLPVGFKNGTDGALQMAVDAMGAAAAPHCSFGVDAEGRAAAVRSAGNRDSVLILRGGRDRPNYDADAVAEATSALAKAGLPARVLIDCSHDNSHKDHRQQPRVLDAVAAQLGAGSEAIAGVMIESNLVAGKQALGKEQPLRYGQSVTDACVDLEQSAQMLARLASARPTAARANIDQSARSQYAKAAPTPATTRVLQQSS